MSLPHSELERIDFTFDGTIAQLGSGFLSLGPNVGPWSVAPGWSARDAFKASFSSLSSSSIVKSITGSVGSGFDADRINMNGVHVWHSEAVVLTGRGSGTDCRIRIFEAAEVRRP